MLVYLNFCEVISFITQNATGLLADNGASAIELCHVNATISTNTPVFSSSTVFPSQDSFVTQSSVVATVSWSWIVFYIYSVC